MYLFIHAAEAPSRLRSGDQAVLAPATTTRVRKTISSEKQRNALELSKRVPGMGEANQIFFALLPSGVRNPLCHLPLAALFFCLGWRPRELPDFMTNLILPENTLQRFIFFWGGEGLRMALLRMRVLFRLAFFLTFREQSDRKASLSPAPLNLFDSTTPPQYN
jgi:hypothetical protein